MSDSLYSLPARQDVVNAPALERDFRGFHEESPLRRAQFPFGGEGWIVTSYDEVKTVLGDERFSLEAALTAGDYPRIRMIETGPPARPAFTWYDPPKHTKKRGVLMKHLSVKRVQALRPRTTEIVLEELERFIGLGSPADIIEGFVRRIPVRVISDLLGAPADEHSRFIDAALVIGNSRAESMEEAAAARATVTAYFSELVERKRAEPADDLISALIDDPAVEELWTEEELLGVGSVLLTAGHDATTAILGGILEWLVYEPTTRERLQKAPETFPAAFEEFVRVLPAGLAGTRSRIAVEDVLVGDTLIKKGEAVLPIVHAANLDEAAFDHADQLDLDRPVPQRPHVAFGFGPHACVGLQLARMEIDVTVRTVLERLPGLAPAEDRPEWKEERLLRGPKRVMVTW